MVIGIEAAHANQAERTGVEEYCFQIIEALKKAIPSDVKVVLYSNAPLREELATLPSNWGVKVLRWPLSKLWTQLRLSWHFLFHKPDVFFSPGQILPMICPKKTVTMVHDSAFMAYPRAYGFLSRVYLRMMNKRIIKKSETIITSTEFNKKELIKFYGAKVGKKVAVIPLGFNTVQPAPNFDPKKFGITKPYILSVGRLETKKNTKYLIQAFCVMKQSVDIQLVLVGRPGVGYGPIAKQIKQCPYIEDIIRLGYIERPDLSGLFKKAVAFIFPSIYEGFGFPLLEALSSGTPAIAADIEALREVGGASCIYVDPFDIKLLSNTILELVKNSGNQIKFSHEGRERAAQFSWESTAAATWNVIAS